MQDLGMFEARAFTRANGINNKGQITGGSTALPAGYTNPHPPFLCSDGAMFNLNDLVESSGNGWLLMEGRGTNDRGQFVGNGTFNGQRRAFLLTPISAISIAWGKRQYLRHELGTLAPS
jgi:hypothetical protein